MVHILQEKFAINQEKIASNGQMTENALTVAGDTEPIMVGVYNVQIYLQDLELHKILLGNN